MEGHDHALDARGLRRAHLPAGYVADAGDDAHHGRHRALQGHDVVGHGGRADIERALARGLGSRYDGLHVLVGDAVEGKDAPAPDGKAVAYLAERDVRDVLRIGRGQQFVDIVLADGVLGVLGELRLRQGHAFKAVDAVFGGAAQRGQRGHENDELRLIGRVHGGHLGGDVATQGGVHFLDDVLIVVKVDLRAGERHGLGRLLGGNAAALGVYHHAVALRQLLAREDDARGQAAAAQLHACVVSAGEIVGYYQISVHSITPSAARTEWRTRWSLSGSARWRCRVPRGPWPCRGQR